jgi:transposase-like protein
MEGNKSQKQPRRQFTDESKAGAVLQVLGEGRSSAEVARSLDLPRSASHQWVKQALVDSGDRGTGALTSWQRHGLAQLRSKIHASIPPYEKTTPAPFMLALWHPCWPHRRLPRTRTGTRTTKRDPHHPHSPPCTPTSTTPQAHSTTSPSTRPSPTQTRKKPLCAFAPPRAPFSLFTRIHKIGYPTHPGRGPQATKPSRASGPIPSTTGVGVNNRLARRRLVRCMDQDKGHPAAEPYAVLPPEPFTDFVQLVKYPCQ